MNLKDVLVLLIYLKNRLSYKLSLLPVISIGAFAGISAEMCLLIMFQSYYGYVYSGISLLTAAFMAGAAAGCGFMNRKTAGILKRSLKLTILFESLYLILLPWFFSAFYLFNDKTSSLIITNLFFPLLTVIPGYFSGAIYTLSSKITIDSYENEFEKDKKAFLPYLMDIVGAALGAVLSAAVLLPVLGIINICLILSFSLLLCLLIAFIYDKK